MLLLFSRHFYRAYLSCLLANKVDYYITLGKLQLSSRYARLRRRPVSVKLSPDDLMSYATWSSDSCRTCLLDCVSSQLTDAELPSSDVLIRDKF